MVLGLFLPRQRIQRPQKRVAVISFTRLVPVLCRRGLRLLHERPEREDGVRRAELVPVAERAGERAQEEVVEPVLLSFGLEDLQGKTQIKPAIKGRSLTNFF